MAKLTAKQQLFVAEYLVDLNATQAAIRAGYSQKTAYRTGADNLKKPQIQEALQLAMQEREKRTQITADRVLEELAKVGFSDIKEYLDFDRDRVRLKPSSEVDGTLLSEVSEGPNGLKIKLHDKMKALEMMGRHLGMFKDSFDVNIKKKLEDFM